MDGKGGKSKSFTVAELSNSIKWLMLKWGIFMQISGTLVFAVSCSLFAWLTYLWHSQKKSIELPEILLGLTSVVYGLLFIGSLMGYVRLG